ncbi:hypothetical protein LCM10_02540 [Rossellomorea aquimaris]|uniref:hypothetical protein n=1 Tax=Rossellomorea aquimaris TaxID=189382 RepID=UPI001CD4DB4B|nr:hypothetical protein [Rossellomorea aquimaris]MCA1053851.1 hypothetical protein [Rossellomorea aquimaris]
MRRELLFAFGAFFILSLHAIAGNFSEEVEEQPKINQMTIKSYFKDVTGDGKRDTIELMAVPFSPDALFLKEIWAEVKTSNGSEIRIDYDSGYEPKIVFVDLNHDGIKDLLYSAATGGSGGLYNMDLHTLADNKLLDLGLPDEPTIQGQFQEEYKAAITFTDTNQSYTVDLSDRKEDYERLGIYTEGQLNEPMELMILPTSFYKPTRIQDKSGKGLKGYQQISGAYKADGIGTAVSYWYYENGKWTLIKINWHEEDRQKHRR